MPHLKDNRVHLSILETPEVPTILYPSENKWRPELENCHINLETKELLRFKSANMRQQGGIYSFGKDSTLLCCT